MCLVRELREEELYNLLQDMNGIILDLIELSHALASVPSITWKGLEPPPSPSQDSGRLVNICQLTKNM